MSSLGGAAWLALIKKLKALVDGPADYNSNTPACTAAYEHLSTVTQRPMTRADWKRLVLESKVSVSARCSQLSCGYSPRLSST
jgi:hypothetical protein